MKVSGNSHSTENLEKCFTLAKNNEGFDENKFKSRLEKTPILKKNKNRI